MNQTLAPSSSGTWSWGTSHRTRGVSWGRDIDANMFGDMEYGAPVCSATSILGPIWTWSWMYHVQFPMDCWHSQITMGCFGLMVTWCSMTKYSCYCLLTHKGLMTLMTWCHKYSEQVMFCGISRCFRPPWIYDDRIKENEQSPVRVWKENCGWILLFIPCEYELFWILLSAGYGKESIYQIKSCLSFTCNYTNSL